MFSMAVAAMRRRRIAAAAALAAALIAPGAAAAAAAAPAAQASVSHPALTGGYGGSRAGNAALNWAEGHARGCWYSYGGSSCYRVRLLERDACPGQLRGCSTYCDDLQLTCHPFLGSSIRGAVYWVGESPLWFLRC